MAVGILCRPYDTDKSFELSENVRVPQYCGEVTYPVDGQWRGVPNYINGSTVHALIISMGSVYPKLNFGYIDSLVSSIEINEGSIRASKNAESLASEFTARCFQILPVGESDYGIRLQNSTNLTEVTNTGACLRPIWRGEVKINGHWQYPDLGGDRSKYIAFVNWNNPSVGLTSNMYAINESSYTGDYWGIACGQADLTGRYDGLGHERSVDAKVVIFYPAEPEITPCGINIFNAAGQCSWSSKYTPFLLRGNLQLARDWRSVSNVSNPLIPVTQPGFFFQAGDCIRQYGIKSNGTSFAATFINSGYVNRGPSYRLDVINPLPLPVISADDYF